MSLLFYIMAASTFCYLLSYFFKQEQKKLFIFLGLVVLLTPGQIVVGYSDFAPAVFTFLFNIILEQNYSMRVLRPLFISIPLGFFCILTLGVIKKRLF